MCFLTLVLNYDIVTLIHSKIAVVWKKIQYRTVYHQIVMDLRKM